MSRFRESFLQGGQLGQFFHFGPYAKLGRGEQTLWREMLDQREYAEMARAWKPGSIDMRQWTDQAIALGAEYAVLTTRHHDSYCLWDTKETNYNSFHCFGRDLVREYVEACRAQGLKVGLYYSLADWTCPAYFQGPAENPEGFASFLQHIRNQVTELLTHYGKIDIIWFDACTPHDSPAWNSEELVRMIRGLQPEILINCRLGVDVKRGAEHIDGGIGPGGSKRFGDFIIGEGRVISGSDMAWETCATSTRARWGFSQGEAWRTVPEIAEESLRVLFSGGNYMLNVGPDPEGEIPSEYRSIALELGSWLKVIRGEMRGAVPFGELTFVNRGWLFSRGNTLYLVLRSWDESGTLSLRDLEGSPISARLLGTQARLETTRVADQIFITDIPKARPSPVYPVIALELDQPPTVCSKTAKRTWAADLKRWQQFAQWAKTFPQNPNT